MRSLSQDSARHSASLVESEKMCPPFASRGILGASRSSSTNAEVKEEGGEGGCSGEAVVTMAFEACIYLVVDQVESWIRAIQVGNNVPT